MPLADKRPPRRSGQPRQIEAQTSALAPAGDVRSRAMRGSVTGTTNWQNKVIQYDREGPGILGYYLDTVALLASLCPLMPTVQGKDGKWIRSSDPVLNVLASGYRSPLFEQSELVSTHVRAREGVGEAWIIHSEDVGWHIVTVPNIVQGSGSDGAVQWTDIFGTRRKTANNRVYKSWVPDPWEPYLPTSPVRRALPNLRRIKSAVRSQYRAADSRLIMNGLIAFDEGEGNNRPLVTDAQQRPEGIDEIIADYLDLAQKGFTDDDSVAANVPFPYIGKKAEYVEVGRGIDQMSMEMEDKAIEGFARDVNFPAQLLTTGPGSSNHWNEWILQEVQQKMGLAPKLNPVCSDITTIYFRPAIRLLKNRVGSWDVDPARCRLEPDYTFLTSKPEKASKAFEAYRLGLIGREEAIYEMGFKELLPIPIGLGEYEHWELATGNKGAPYVEVDASGRLILPPVEPPMLPEAPVEEAPVEAVPVEAVPVAEMPVPVDGSTTDQSPPAEPTGELPVAPTVYVPDAKMAAVGDNPEDPEDTGGLSDTEKTVILLAALVAIDSNLEIGLDATATAAATAAMVAIAKAIIRAYPARDPERARLRDLPPEQVWAEANPSIRSQVDVEQIAAETLEPFKDQIEERFANAADEVAAAQAENDDSIIIDLLIAAAAVALVVGLTKLISGWITSPATFTRDAVERTVGRKVLRVPQSLIRSAMAIAGGAAADLAGNLLNAGSGTPTPVDGGQWVGNSGMATGHNSLSGIKVPAGSRIVFMWKHGLYRTPKEPFLPHVGLNEHTFTAAADVPGGFYPGDHPWCSCGLVPMLEKI